MVVSSVGVWVSLMFFGKKQSQKKRDRPNEDNQLSKSKSSTKDDFDIPSILTTQSSDSRDDLKSSPCLQHVAEGDIQLLELSSSNNTLVSSQQIRKSCLKSTRKDVGRGDQGSDIQSISREVTDVTVAQRSSTGSVGCPCDKLCFYFYKATIFRFSVQFPVIVYLQRLFIYF